MTDTDEDDCWAEDSDASESTINSEDVTVSRVAALEAELAALEAAEAMQLGTVTQTDAEQHALVQYPQLMQPNRFHCAEDVTRCTGTRSSAARSWSSCSSDLQQALTAAVERSDDGARVSGKGTQHDVCSIAGSSEADAMPTAQHVPDNNR